MRRELAKLEPQEAFDWLAQQELSVKIALEARSISNEVADSLLERLSDELCEYLFAYDQGLLKGGK